MKPLILFDSKKCIGCHSCEVACQLENDAPPGVQLRWVKSHIAGGFPESRIHSISTACFHCGDPSCVSACPSGALRRRPDGVVEHLRNRCIGCAYCVKACPFGVPRLSPSQHTMRKCSFCIQRIDRGREPACVAKCTTNALRYFLEGSEGEGLQAYGRNEGLHMVYSLEGRPEEFALPEPVPLNTTTSLQVWKWLAGVIPGGVLLAWLWKKIGDQGDADE